jgi:uncharacterized protein (UPF0335 family)
LPIALPHIKRCPRRSKPQRALHLICPARSARKITAQSKEINMSNSPDTYNVAADELRQFIERIEQLDAEKRDLAEQQKEVMAEAKGRGYDTKVMRKVIALRKRKPDDIAEEEAILDMYKSALGMG